MLLVLSSLLAADLSSCRGFAATRWREVPWTASRRVARLRGAPRHDIDLQRGIGSGHIRRRQPQLPPHNVAPLRNGARFVKRNLPVAALPPKSAIVGHNQLLRGNVLERFANLGSHLFRTICLQHAMADGADGDLLL